MYTEYVLKSVPKVLTQLDRDKDSKTFGDCDRNHWHLKVRDFSSAILQQTGLTIALLYTVDFKGNIFYHIDEVKEWAIGTVYYWKSIQLQDGSFNEYYPHEHGFPPTAFSLYSACEVYKRLDMQDDEVLKCFRKTARYLISHIEKKAYNQEIASITALYSAYTVLKEQWVLDGINNKLNRILKLQSTEGWFSEYGGADIGYLSVSLDMLAEYYWMSRDFRVLEPLNRIVEFLKYFVHPDGTIGGEYASRNTIYFLPNGLQVMACLKNESAFSMICDLFDNTKKDFYFLDAVDDRYFSHYLLHSFLRAIEKEKNIDFEQKAIQLPYMYNQEKYFEEAGIYIKSWENKYVIISVAKGGVCRAWFNGHACFNDYGYRVKMENKKVATTNWQNLDYTYSKKDNCIKVIGFMNKVSQKMSTPIMHLGLRIVSFVVGNKIIGFLKNQIILVNKKSDVYFERSIFLTNNSIIFEDLVKSPNQINLECAGCFSLRHVASGKFFSIADISKHSKKSYANVKHIRVRREYCFETNEITEMLLDE